MRHGKYEPGPIPTFWKSEMTQGRITELEYYRHIYPRTIIKEFFKKLNVLFSNDPDVVFEQIEILMKEYKEMLK